MRFAQIRHAAPLIALCLTACKLDLTGLDLMGGQLTGISVRVDGPFGSLPQVGDIVTLSAFGHIDGLASLLWYDPVNDARWTVSDTTIARIETVPELAQESTGSTCRLYALKPGTVQVRAAARGKEDMLWMLVIPRVARIDVLPMKDTITVDELTSVAAVTRDSAGSVIGGLPLQFEADWGVSVGPVRPSINYVEVKGLHSGRWNLSARFRNVVGRTHVVVVPR